MYTVTEHIFEPLLAYSTPKEELVETQKELLNLPWIKAYTKNPKYARFSISEKDDCKYLMIENDNCTWWWLVAILPKNFPASLPLFKSKNIIIED